MESVHPGTYPQESSTKELKKNKNINVSINRTIDNGEDLTNVIIKGSGNVTREELDAELERLLKEHGIDKNNSNINIEIEINN